MAGELNDVDKTGAFLIELLPGLFGFLGIGYIFAGDVTGGVIRLVVWLAIVAVTWIVISILTIFLIGLCLMPFMIIAQIGIPIWSAFSLKKKLESAYPE